MITVTTPALLFPAISLLLLAYSTRFLHIATLIRQLHGKYVSAPEEGVIFGQIANLRKRLQLIKIIQVFGVLSFLFCVLSMIFILEELELLGKYVFAISLVLLFLSLVTLLVEVYISTGALELELSDMEFRKKK